MVMGNGGTNSTVELILREMGGMGGPGSGGGGGPSAPGGGDTKKMGDYLKGISNNTRKSLGATLGIKLGTASILKQSQVFTGFIGTIFQLMGALVDVILAPFLPILIPGIKLIAQMIPYVAKYSQAIFDFLDRTLFQWIRNAMNLLPGGIKDKIIPALSALLVGAFFLKMTGLWGPFSKLVGGFIAKPLWALVSTKLTSGLAKLLKLDTDMVAKLGLKAVLKQTLKEALKTAGTRIVTFVRTQLNMRLNTIKGLFKVLGGYLDEPLKFIKGKLVGLADFIRAPFAKLWANIGARFFSPIAGELDNFALRFLGSAKTWIAELPIVQGAMKFFNAKGLLGKAGGLFGRAMGAVKGKAGTGLKVLGTSMKGVPVLGAVAELGFGAYQTYQDVRKYGWKEGAMRGALTLANTATALVDPTGVASAAGSIGSNIMMSRAFRNNAVSEGWAQRNQDLVIKVVGEDGQTKYYEKKYYKDDTAVEASPGMSTDRTTMDGYP